MMGIECTCPEHRFQSPRARAEKLLTITAGDNVVRLLPPLIVTEDEIAEASSGSTPRALPSTAEAEATPERHEPQNDARPTIFSTSRDFSARDCGASSTTSAAMKARAARAQARRADGRSPARCWR